MRDRSLYIGRVIDFIPLLLVFIMLYGAVHDFICPIEAHGQSLSIEDDSVEVGKSFNIPIFLDVEDQAPTSYQFYLRYDSLGLQYDTLDVSGTVSEGMFITTNKMNRGLLKIAAAGVSQLPSGTIVNLQFTGIQERSDSIYIEHGKIDETMISSWSNGEIRVLDMFLPIDLVEFFAFKADETTVIVRWVTASESNVDRFYVDRYDIGNDIPWYEIGSFKSQNLMYGGGYSWLNNDVTPGVYKYRMRAVDFDGSFLITAPSDPVSMGNATNTEVWPNPLIADDVWYNVEPSQTSETIVEVFNILGQRVAYDEIPLQHQGPRSVSLSGCPPGVYIVRVTRPFRTESELITKL